MKMSHFWSKQLLWIGFFFVGFIAMWRVAHPGTVSFHACFEEAEMNILIHGAEILDKIEGELSGRIRSAKLPRCVV